MGHWLLIAVATGGAWVFYFTDAPTLLVDLFTLDAHPDRLYHHRHPDRHDVFLRRFRARADLHLCLPLAAHPGRDDGRGHADRGYREWRGEPRKHSEEVKNGAEQGDCIDCMACVNVCPVGIDIRDGQQLECITCALCIDACDDIMEKIGKPRGLIDYMALTDESASARASAQADLEARLPPAHDALHRAVVAGGARAGLCAVHPLGYRHDRGPGAQPDLRDHVRRLDPQHLRGAAAQQARRGRGPSADRQGRSGDAPARWRARPTPRSRCPPTRCSTATGLPDRASGLGPGAGDRTEVRLWVEDISRRARLQDTVFNGKAN